MATDPFSTLNPSDSGFLNSFLPPTPATPLQSRVGEEPTTGGEPAPDSDPGPDSESVLEDDPPTAPSITDAERNRQAASIEPTLCPSDERLDGMLRSTPLPEGFLARMHRIVDGV